MNTQATVTTSAPQPTITKKGGKGNTHGTVSEITAFLSVKPGKTEEMRAGIERFHARVRKAPFWALQKIGIRDMRHAIFDNGTRLLWITAFDTDWDPYIDDAVEIIGVDGWVDWLQHTVEYPLFYEADGKPTFASIKRALQIAQVRADGFFQTFHNLTISQIKRGEELTEAFDQVLEAPGALEALQNPVLKPLLDKASG